MSADDVRLLVAMSERYIEIGFFESARAAYEAVAGSQVYAEKIIRHLRSGGIIVNRVDGDEFQTIFGNDPQ